MAQNRSGKPLRVFTPFWRNCLAQSDPPEPLPAPRPLAAPAQWPKSIALGELELEPRIKWAEGFRAVWQPGAADNLKKFLAQAFDPRSDQRNRPDRPGTSRLSPHLHFGEISPRQVWHGLERRAIKRVFNPTTQGEKFDPHGDYVRRWCSELANLPPDWIHQPNRAPTETLRAAGVDLGRT